MSAIHPALRRLKRSLPAAFFALVAIGAAMSGGCVFRRRSLDSMLLITLDTLRADHVSCYGPSPVDTPNLDSMARKGARIVRAWTPIPLTTPAHATILTGLYPSAHGVRNNGRFRLPDDVTTLAEVLKAANVRTAAFVASFTTLGVFGLSQGFDVYDDDLGNDSTGERRSRRPANEVVERAIQWLTANAGAPFLLWVHLYDPHFPYEAPAAYQARFPGDHYSAAVAFTDDQLGQLLQALDRTGAGRRTVVVAVADHGEGLKSHGEDHHGLLLYEEALRVPFLVVAPGRIAPGTLIGELTSTVDVLPTALGLLGRAVPPGVQGRDLLAASATGNERRRVYGETLFPYEELRWSALYAIREGDLKYIKGPDAALFDLSADPGEQHDLTLQRQQDVRRLDAALVDMAGKIANHERLAKAAGMGAANPDAIERLRTLGYIAGGSTGDGASGALPALGGRNPRDMMEVYYALHDAEALQRSNRAKEALERLTRVEKIDPDNPQVLLRSAQCWESMHDPARAEEIYRELLRRQPDFYLGYRYLSHLLLQQRRAQEARELWLLLWERLPGYVEISVQLAEAEIAAGMAHEAAARLAPYLQARPDDADGWQLFGRALAATGRSQEALRAFQSCLRLRPTSEAAVDGAVKLLVGSGHRNEARQLLDGLLERAPRDPMLLKVRAAM